MNDIPIEFKKIIGKMLVKTNVDKKNDIIHVYGNNETDLFMSVNIRNGIWGHVPKEILDNDKKFKILSIIK